MRRNLLPFFPKRNEGRPLKGGEKMEIAGFSGLIEIPAFAGGKESPFGGQPVKDGGGFKALMLRYAGEKGEEQGNRQGKGEKSPIPSPFMPPFVPARFPDQTESTGDERPPGEVGMEEWDSLLSRFIRLLDLPEEEADRIALSLGMSGQEGTRDPADERAVADALEILSQFIARFLEANPDPAKAFAGKQPSGDLTRSANAFGTMEQWLKAGAWKNDGELLRLAEKLMQDARPDFIKEIFARMADGGTKPALPVVKKPAQFGIPYSGEPKGTPEAVHLPPQAGNAADFSSFSAKLEIPTLFLVKEGKPLTYQQFIDQLQAVIAKSAFQKFGNTEQLTVRLHPKELGALKIQLIQQEQGLTAKIVTSTTAAKEILESQLHALRQAFVQQNITVDRIELIHVHSERKETLPQYSGDNGRNPGREQQNPEKREDEQEHSFSETLLNYEI
ncbi:MAG: hypothetical protein C6W56_06605 [Caldibacillus debilis]|nr:hypothetical protein [Bacillaceae bacterium]REJ29199.1 MAG: hypothetical protein C6W56_06605 [Caldibacillus debilis]